MLFGKHFISKATLTEFYKFVDLMSMLAAFKSPKNADSDVYVYFTKKNHFQLFFIIGKSFLLSIAAYKV